MGFLIAYLLGFAIACTYRFNKMEGISSTKVVLASLFYPLEYAIALLSFITTFFGVYLEFKILVIMSEKEKEDMTDKMMEALRDRLEELDENDGDDDEK